MPWSVAWALGMEFAGGGLNPPINAAVLEDKKKKRIIL